MRSEDGYGVPEERYPAECVEEEFSEVSYYVVHRERTEAICCMEWQIWCSYRVSAWEVER
jgi:hypothetical protein